MMFIAILVGLISIAKCNHPHLFVSAFNNNNNNIISGHRQNGASSLLQAAVVENEIDSKNTSSSSHQTADDSSSSSPLISSEDIHKISKGGVAIIPNWLPSNLVTSMRNDARHLFETDQFQPDGLTNTALGKPDQQGFTKKADRQTFRGGAGWDSTVGDTSTRMEFANRMKELRTQLSIELDRPTLKDDGRLKHEMTYNWYEPGAKLGKYIIYERECVYNVLIYFIPLLCMHILYKQTSYTQLHNIILPHLL